MTLHQAAQDIVGALAATLYLVMLVGGVWLLAFLIEIVLPHVERIDDDDH